MLPSTMKSFVDDARTTLNDWAIYKHKTGKLPWLSIAVHSLNCVVAIGGMGYLIWFGGRHHYSHWQFAFLVIPLAIAYAAVWYRIKGAVKLHELRNRRQLEKLRADSSRN